MSLQTLEWRKLPVRIFQSAQTVSTVLDIVSDILTGSLYFDNTARVPGSGSAWSIAGEFATGSNNEALWCTPPYQAAFSQSVMFAGKNLTGLISSGSPAVVTNQTAFTAGYLYGSIVRSATGSFTQWTSTYPFGSGSYSSGFATATQLLSGVGIGDRLYIYESKEAIGLFIYDTGANTAAGIIAGAIIDPEQSNPTSSLDAEADGRLYGLVTTDVSMNSTFFTNSNSYQYFLSQNTGTNTGARFVAFVPRSNSLMNVTTEKNQNTTGNYFYPTINYSTISGKFVKTPLKCCRTDSNVPTSYLGRLRDISLIKNSPSGLVVRNNTNGNIIGFTIGASESSVSDTVMLNYST